MVKTIFILTLAWLATAAGYAQRPGTHTDESKVPAYTLPELLVTQKGKKIKTVAQWEKTRKPEILELFRDQVYGRVPGKMGISKVMVHESNGEALGGQAVRKQVDLIFGKDGRELSVGVLIYLPENVEPAPVFLGLNFLGNHTVSDDPEIRITESWVRDNPSLGIIHNQATEQSRGVQAERWPIEQIIRAGYGVVTAYYGDIDPDLNQSKDSFFEDGIHPFFYKAGQTAPAADEWGAIAAWAWGLSRIMDYLEQDGQIDSRNVIVIGHSRLGKTALWAAANDQRFAACISNNSGCMGAALSRRCFGETVAVINYSFPHWFATNFKQYNGKEDDLPVDQHMLLALIAPRPLYVASATEDLWADPKGEFLSAKHTKKVYRLYGLEGLAVDDMPAPDTPVSGVVGYHLRSGKHNITAWDWEQYIRFAREQTGKGTGGR